MRLNAVTERLLRPLQLTPADRPQLRAAAPAWLRSFSKTFSRDRPGRRLSAMTAAAAKDAGATPTSDATDAAYKERVRDMWAKRGATYDAGDTLHPALCEQLVALAGIHPGAAVLDVATGTGEPGHRS